MASPHQFSPATNPQPNWSDELFFDALVRSYVDLKENPRFLRREWLAKVLNEKLDETGHHFVLLTAEPGAGKSVFIAQLSHDHPEWLRYFIRRDQRSVLADVSDRSFLLRIGYQFSALHPELFTQEQLRLSIRQRFEKIGKGAEAVGAEVKRLVASPFYQKVLEVQQRVRVSQGRVVGLRVEELFVEPRLLASADLLQLALIDPASSLQRIDPTKRVVVLVDALDEIGYHSTLENILLWLTNCPDLPENVRFVLTSRPPDETIKLFCEKQASRLSLLAIDEQNPHVRADVTKFLQRLITEEPLAQELAHTLGGPEGFVQRATDKAGGNLGYLEALARGIEQGLKRKDSKTVQAFLCLKQLPTDLEGLYAFFLHQIKTSVGRERIELKDVDTGETYDKPVWPAVYDRVLGVLTVVMEPVDADLIRQLGEIRADCPWILQAMDRLLQFLDVIDRRYRFYHATVAEFLAADKTRVDVETQDLYQDSKRWHRQIAEHYWQTYHEHWEKCDDPYGLNHLSNHLLATGDGPRVRELICEAWIIGRSKQGEPFGRIGLIGDLDRAWSTALSELQGAAKLVELFRLQTARQVITQQTAAHSDIDLCTLVWLGRVDQAVAICELRSTPSGRYSGLRAILRSLHESSLSRSHTQIQSAELVDEWVHRALNLAEAAARAIPNEAQRVKALGEVACALDRMNDRRADVVLDEVKQIALDRYWFEEVAAPPGAERFGTVSMVSLAEVLIEMRRLPEAEDIAHTIKDDALLERIKTSKTGAAKSNETEGATCQTHESGRPVAMDEKLDESQNDTHGVEVAKLTPDQLSEVAYALARKGVDLALANARLNDAIEARRQATGGREPPIELIVALLIDEGLLAEAHDICKLVQNPLRRADALRKVGAALAEVQHERAGVVFDEAFKAAASVSDSRERTQALRTLAETLDSVKDSRSTHVFEQAFQSVHEIDDPDSRVREICSLAFASTKAGIEWAATACEQAINLVHSTTGNSPALLRIASETLANCHYFEKSKGIAFEIHDDHELSISLGYLAERFADAGEFIAADETADAIPDDTERVGTLLNLVKTFVRKGDSRAGLDLDEAVKVANTIDDEWSRATALCNVGLYLAEAKNGRSVEVFTDALKAADAIKDPETRSLELTHLGLTLHQIGETRADMVFKKARQAANDIEGPEEFLLRGHALAELASALAQCGEFKDAERVIKAIELEEFKAPALRELALAVAESGQPAESIFDEAQNQLNAIQKYWIWHAEARNLAVALGIAGCYTKALAFLQSFDLDEFTDLIIEIISRAKKSNQSASVDILREVSGVAGWLRPLWRQIHDMLAVKTA